MASLRHYHLILVGQELRMDVPYRIVSITNIIPLCKVLYNNFIKLRAHADGYLLPANYRFCSAFLFNVLAEINKTIVR